MFGSKTKNAVIEYQRNNGLLQDGKIGNITWNVLMNEVVGKGKTNTTILQ